MINPQFLTTAHWVLEDEIKELKNLKTQLDESFSVACQMIIDCRGKIIFCGVGHSGHIARKSAANLSSLCRPACFLHAGEATHGDLGLVAPDDLVIFISNSGETPEILTILPFIQSLGAKTIAIVGNLNSSLSQASSLALPLGAQKEAGPIKYAGSSSALNSMALCDALVMAIAFANGMTEKAYLRVHPGGAVGKNLRAKYESNIKNVQDE